MAQNPKARQSVRQGPSPEALAAFYRHRSESLRTKHEFNSTQSKQMAEAQVAESQQLRPSVGIVEYVLSALQGHPGYMNK